MQGWDNNLPKIIEWIFKTGIKAITLYCDDEIETSNLCFKQHKAGNKNLFFENGKAILVLQEKDSEQDFHKNAA